MRVLIAASSSSVHTHRWVEALSNYHDVYLFSLEGSPRIDLALKGGRFLSLSRRGIVRSYGFFSFKKVLYFKGIPELKAFFKKVSPDIFHAYYATSYGMLGRFLPSNSEVPRVVSVWGSDVLVFPDKSFLHRGFLGWILKGYDVIQSTSKAMVDKLSLLYPWFSNKEIFVLPFGIDVDLYKQNRAFDANLFLKICFDEEDWVKRRKQFFIVGILKSLEKVYGIDVLLKAAALLIKENKIRNLLVCVGGEGSQKEGLKTMATELGIDKNVRFIGWVDPTLIPGFYSMVDVAVFPSRMESFGVSALEAMACGKPVIVSRVPGLLEIVPEGEAGLSFEVDDYRDLAQKIYELYRNRNLREKMGENARKHVFKNYDFSKCVEKQLEIYERLTSRRRA